MRTTSLSQRALAVTIPRVLLLCLASLWPSCGFAATFTVSNTNDSGAGSLRQAILDANASPGADKIVFDIPEGGVHTISPLAALPALTDDAGLAIDGYTQPGSSPNTLAVGDDAVLTVELSGAAAGTNAVGVALQSSSNLVRGLVINRFERAVWVQKGTGNIVKGCFIGTDPAGTSSQPNHNGIVVFGSDVPALEAESDSIPDATVIGGSDPGERNLISGSGSSGVAIGFIAGSARILGNYIGTNASGNAAIGNVTGISSSFSGGLTIGGTSSGSGNLISGNMSAVILFGESNCLVQGNGVIGVSLVRWYL